jgi:SpoVK/Ycf46/Vps4 family AAA+-type ATPase
VLDGIEKNNPYINALFMAATNCLEDLDEALIRSGRFDKIIKIEKPNMPERAAAFKLFLTSRELSMMPFIKLDTADVDTEEAFYIQLAMIGEGLSYADIKNVIKQVKNKALLENKDAVKSNDFAVIIEELKAERAARS